MSRIFRDDLEQRFEDLEFAKAFGAARAKSSLALTLAKAREKVGLTQKRLASKLGVSQSYVAKLEGGEANPTFGRIGSLLAMVGLSLTTGTEPLSPYPHGTAATTGGVIEAKVEPIYWGDTLTSDTAEGSPLEDEVTIRG